ncbi:MAG: adenylate/guanylate cyclase domain-containing protein [Candidatus Marinarcus sp.]|uniref:adenylate/guanylate cyclase domain-containing protein n=1 Tax=Candidatus Marinarcus sp. TaxID=3100987 RepID=UPI003B008025
MNIRKKVIFSFIILILFIISISILSLITTYQMKENSAFAKQVSTLINIQEDMNDLINLTTAQTMTQELQKVRETFNEYEKSFEALRKEISQQNQKDMVDFLLNDIHQNNHVIDSLLKLFDNEHSIEVIFDEIFDFQNKKIIHNQRFNELYPKENDKRKVLQSLIFKTKNLELIQEFGNLQYYSKETLYQHRDKERFLKWVGSVDTIMAELKKYNYTELLNSFKQYKQIVDIIGNLAIDIHGIEKEEKTLINKLVEILQHNKDESIFIETKIEKITEQFLSRVSLIQFILVVSIILITLILTLYISSKLTNIIKKLSSGVKQLRDGDYDVQIIINEDREFNEIATTFNKMADNIKENQNTLEEKIKQRTTELQTAFANIQNQKDLLENLSNKLAKYLSPQLFESIFSGKQDVVIESKRKYLTVFFSDIQGFTDLTDSIETESLTQLLNEYLDIMSSIAIKHGGTIDKYIGDCIMVFFGDPLSNGKTQDALNCINMAIEMKEQMSHLRIKWQNDGYSKPFHIRMGINSGYCTVGNFGSKNRLDYTIIGGVVNLASRLESNATLDQILISSETYMLIKENIQCTKKEELTLKGIAHPIQTYEVLSGSGNSTIIKEENGFNLMVDLNEIDKNNIISILENTLQNIRKI